MICMPWGSISRPSLAMALLKRCITSAGFHVDLHYLNVAFAKQIGLPLYEQVADCSEIEAEWFFSQRLFGRSGLGEMQNTWAEINEAAAAADLRDRLIEAVGGSEEICASIANTHVPQFIDECISTIDWSQYDVIGFTTTFAQSLSSLLLARHIKSSFPGVAIVFGGANVDSNMGVESLRAFEWVDYVVHGEAEHSYPQLLLALSSDSAERALPPGVSGRIDNLLVRGDNSARPLGDLNQSPCPDYSDYLTALDRAGLRNSVRLTLYFESSRGCWWGAKHHCTFCGLNATTMSYRKKNADRTLADIVHISHEYRSLRLAAVDNILPLDYLSTLLPEIAKLDLDVKLFYEVKANLRREQLRALKSAGVVDIQPGIESLSSRLLGLMRKGISAIQNVQLLKWCFEEDIHASWNLLYGFPGETDEDYKLLGERFRMVSHLRPPRAIGPIRFERFSPYFFDSEKFNLRLYPSHLYESIYPRSRVALDEIAYYFDSHTDANVSAVNKYLEEAIREWNSWRTSWEQKEVYCYYEKGPEFLIIHDNRNRGSSLRSAPRRFALSDTTSKLYLYCDECRSVESILRYMREVYSNKVSDNEVRAMIHNLAAQDLVLWEEDRVLALAVRSNSPRLSQVHINHMTPN